MINSISEDDMYLSNEFPLPAHEGDAVLHGQVQSPLCGLLQREVKVKPTAGERKSTNRFHFFPIACVHLVYITSR